MLELKHLRTLQCLYRHGSFTAAAEQLSVTTSALSHQIAELEHVLGTALLSRKTRPFQFTAEGLLLLELAEQVLPQVEQKLAHIQAQKHHIHNKLLVASECHSCFDWLIPVLNAYRQNFPDVDLDFSTAFESYPHEMVTDGEIDILITSDRQKRDGIRYSKLFEYESRLVLPPQHPLLYERELTAEKIAAYTLISHPVDLPRLDIYKYVFEPNHLQPNSVRQTQLTPMLIQLVASGRGIAALPDWVVFEYEQKGVVKSRRLPSEHGDDAGGLMCTLYACYAALRTEQVFFREFLAQMKKHARERAWYYVD